MKYGIESMDWAILDELVLMPLRSLGCRIFLFGSRATGSHRKFSDVDLLLTPADPLGLPLHKIYEVRTAIEESRFPYKVDLVLEAELAESYRESILSERVEL